MTFPRASLTWTARAFRSTPSATVSATLASITATLSSLLGGPAGEQASRFSENKVLGLGLSAPCAIRPPQHPQRIRTLQIIQKRRPRQPLICASPPLKGSLSLCRRNKLHARLGIELTTAQRKRYVETFNQLQSAILPRTRRSGHHPRSSAIRTAPPTARRCSD